jgi:hypothetical protein
VAILVGSRDHRTQFWKGAIQESLQQNLVDIGSVVSEEKIFFLFHSPFFLICIIGLKPLNQIKPNLAGMDPGWVPFNIVSDSPALHSRWLLLLRIEISSIVHCCFSISNGQLKKFLFLVTAAILNGERGCRTQF